MCCIDVVFTIFIIYVIGILVCMIQQGSFNHCPRRDLEARELYEDKCSPFPHNPDSDSPHPHRIIILSVAISCNNNNNNRVDIYGAVIMASHCESSPGSFDACRLNAKVAANPQTKPTDLDCESAERKQLPSTSTTAILLLLSPRADTHFTVPRRVDLGTAVRVCSPCPRLYIAVAVVINTTACGKIRTWVLSHRSQACYR